MIEVDKLALSGGRRVTMDGVCINCGESGNWCRCDTNPVADVALATQRAITQVGYQEPPKTPTVGLSDCPDDYLRELGDRIAALSCEQATSLVLYLRKMGVEFWWAKSKED